MDNLIQSIFLTSLLIFSVIVFYIKYRGESCKVGEKEVTIVVITGLLSLACALVCALIIIWT